MPHSPEPLELRRKPRHTQALPHPPSPDNKPGAQRLCDQAGAQPAWRL